MRVAVVTVDTHQLNETTRTRRLRRLIHQLAERGNDVTVCCTQWWEGTVDEFEQDGITYRRVTSERAPGSFATRIPFVLRKVRPDVVLASYWPPAAAVGAETGRWLSRSPVVLEWYGDKPVTSDERFVSRSLRWANAIVTPSEHVNTKVRELGADDEVTQVIPNSIDLDQIRSSAAKSDGPDIVTARHLDEAANVDMMLLGLAELRDRDWSAAVIGDGPARDSFEQKAAELRIDDRVTFTGELTREERISYYKAAHVFVQTAEHCPFATELLRALASGCVGIVDYQQDSAAHELVEALERGFRTTDPEELSEAIEAAAELDELEYDDLFERYGHEPVMNQYLSVFDDVIG